MGIPDFNGLSDRNRARLAGLFILTAYLLLLAVLNEAGWFVLLVDAASGVSVIAVALLLYPVLRPSGPGLAAGYLTARAVEGSLMVLAGLLALFGFGEARDAVYGTVHVIMFVVGAALLYILLYRSAIVPRFIAVWGMVATACLAVVTVLGWFDVSNEVLSGTLVLMITNEVFLAFWLIVKGFAATHRRAEAMVSR